MRAENRVAARVTAGVLHGSGAAKDVGGGFAGGLVCSGSCGGGGLRVAGIFEADGGAATGEGFDGGERAFGAEDFLARAGEVADGGEDRGDRRGLIPRDEGGDHQIKLGSDLGDRLVGLEVGGDEVVVERRRDGGVRALAAQATLVPGFLRLGKRVVWSPGAGKPEVVDEVEAGGGRDAGTWDWGRGIGNGISGVAGVLDQRLGWNGCGGGCGCSGHGDPLW